MIEIIYCETWNHNDLSINIYNVLVKHMFISNQITSLYHYIKLNVLLKEETSHKWLNIIWYSMELHWSEIQNLLNCNIYIYILGNIMSIYSIYHILTVFQYEILFWVWPPLKNTDHRDYYMFLRGFLQTFICHCDWKGSRPKNIETVQNRDIKTVQNKYHQLH